MDKHLYYLDVAKTVAKRSKCVSMSVGCVLVKDDQIISTGINGTPKRYKNCCDHYLEGKDDTHHEWSLKYEIHSEMNAMLRCNTSLQGSTAYITHSPCHNCLKHMIAAGIKDIYFLEQYYRQTEDERAELATYAFECGVKTLQCLKGYYDQEFV